jgi:hypothetical protein
VLRLRPLAWGLLNFVCAAAHADPMAQRVAALVEQTTDAATEMQAFRDLEATGEAGVPYIVGHLGDERPLPVKHISLVNHASDAFEGMRHYAPQTVHDALSAILNQITGEFFVAVENGATSAARAQDKRQWQEWCARKYLDKADVCAGK